MLSHRLILQVLSLACVNIKIAAIVLENIYFLRVGFYKIDDI